MVTRIQLLGTTTGYLDVEENVVVPINISIGDIKDISKRTGTYSKTIKLPGTKNNNSLLNDYFEVNIVDGTFNVNKIQECILLQNNIPVVENAYLQLVSVLKQQATNNEDDLVEYEIVIKNNIADFFSNITNRELVDLDFTEYTHQFTGANIVSSFNNTVVDGYKYLMPWSSTNNYKLNEFKPAIYAKQYWDKIHAYAGFSYDWSTLTNSNVRFDKLIIPFNGDEKKLNEDTLDLVRIIAENTSTQNFIETSTGATQGSFKFAYTDEFRQSLVINNEIVDPNNRYFPVTSEYSSEFNIVSPNAMDFVFEIDYDIIINNLSTHSVKILNPTAGAPSKGEWRVGITVYNNQAPINNNTTTVYPDNYTPQQLGTTFPIGQTTIFSSATSITASVTDLNINDFISFYIDLEDKNNSTGFFDIVDDTLTPTVEVIVKVNSIQLTIQPNVETVLYDSPVNLNSYIPKKVKQSDFVKSIMNMYNLFVEIDPEDSNKLIYKHRDNFYDSGSLKDWTLKLARDKEQDLKFLPEINAKKILLTYKEDSDSPNEVYTEATNEIYGQQEIVFQNNYVKGIDKKEIIFSPTPSQNSVIGAVLPLIEGGSPKNNLRILLDNGEFDCRPFFIENYTGNVVTSVTYPFLSHLDKQFNPTFDINYGVCDFYFYNIINYTNNNLYNNFWRRTMAQLDSGKLLIAYFNLNETDISNLKLNDKIRIDNSYWNINKIVDYNANSKQLTKVELMSIDDNLKLPSFGKTSEFIREGLVPIRFTSIYPTATVRSLQQALQEFNETKAVNTSVNNSSENIKNYGNGNVIDGDIRAIILSDNKHIKENGIYIGDYVLNEQGKIINTSGTIIDGGLDIVMNLYKTNPQDIIDGCKDSVLTLGGIISNPITDGGTTSPEF